MIHTASGRRRTFGALAGAAAKLTVPENPLLRQVQNLVGRHVPRLDIPEKVDGRAVFGIDVRVPGMVYAAIRQAPVFRSRLLSVDADAIKGMRGIVDVVKLPDAVAVVADSYWRAQKALDLVKASFALPPQARYTTEDIIESQRLQLGSPVAVTAVQAGNSYTVMDRNATIQADFRAPYLYHATMETMNCTVSLTDDKCEYWLPTQWMSAVVDTGTRLTGLPAGKIVVHPTLLGGGFGRKFEMDYVEQATLIAKAVKRPVQLIWSRQEDIQHGFYRPLTSARLKAVLKDGDIEAMSIRVVSASIAEFRFGGVPFNTGFDSRALLGVSTETTESPGKLQQYTVDNFTAEAVYQPAHVPCGSWRAVGASENGFFIECFMDELAEKANQDPYQFRRHLLRKSPRGLAVLDKVAVEAKLDKPAQAGRFRGIAFSECVGSMVAQVVEASVEKGQAKVHQVWCAIDCGTAVSPDSVKAQVEGSIIMSLSSALHEQITIRNGRCEQSGFHDYEVMKLASSPKIEVFIINSGHPLGGVGEAALPATIPALCSALYKATGKRIRSLPIVLDA